MASLSELRTLFNRSDLRNKVTAALVIAAQVELSATPGTISGRAWAIDALSASESWSDVAFKSVLAMNSGASIENIKTASDATIQAAVDSLVPTIIIAHTGA